MSIPLQVTTFMARALAAFVMEEMPKGLDAELVLCPGRTADGAPTGRTAVQFVGVWPGLDEVDGSFNIGQPEGYDQTEAEDRARRAWRVLVDAGAAPERIRITTRECRR